ncbi:nitrite reductase large subunit NirB [Metabacillus malikii]|uniref:Nitrite reductase (NADH) large subunit n=1 Tax=Metabacillus malikii TaxID=1504265 RepID=A0ABT9ZEY7_9BACI|nr:nitrite reductase large subunit NirB [Metabacillus malikii]MDQ0230821.1 nitrite reductase (NADH) large subunit [Metabacillus malikii]
MRQRLVVIGNGMAGVRTVEEIIKRNPNLYTITIIGSEIHPNYNRILLSSVLQGKAQVDEITINQREWYRENGISLLLGETAVNIDTNTKEVKTNQNRTLYYDKLIIATGSVPFILPIPGVSKEGVTVFRTIEDCNKIIEASTKYRRAVVIGGGVLGLEAAQGLINLGLNVKVVHNTDHLMQRQLDSTVSKLVQHTLEKQGIQFLLGKMTKEIVGDNRVERLTFTDGTEVEADLVVMAIGVKPNIALATESGIKTNRGIIVNDFLETNIANVYGVGECVEHEGVVYGLVKPLYEQGKILANYLCGISNEGYRGSVLSTGLKVPGIELFSAGEVHGPPESKMIVVENQLDNIYKKIIFHDDKIIGALLYGDTKSGRMILDYMSKRRHVSEDDIQTILNSSRRDDALFQSMDDAELICNCNAVTKGAIVEAVFKNDLNTVDQVKQCTKASSSCGSCLATVTDLLAYLKSDACTETYHKKTLCECTTLSEEEVVHQIQQDEILHIQEVFTKLNWKTPNGCVSCKRALNYYFAMIYPKNEEVFLKDVNNAQLHEDGTYSMVLQLHGGLTNATNLKRITDVMNKYGIRELGITTEQSFRLLGIRRDVLQNVCKELRVRPRPSHLHKIVFINTFYKERTCACNSEILRNLASELENELVHVFTPHRLVMAMSACKHEDIELKTRDVCVIGDYGKYEIYVGGTAKHQPSYGELFAVASDSTELKQYICSFIQYYRETANYLESVAEWVMRVGLIHIREVVFEMSLSEQLVERLIKI